MKLQELKKIDKLYVGYDEIARAFGISMASAAVTANRYVKNGLLIRIKRNLYIIRDVWDSVGREEKFVLVNMGQVPSYISLMTALDYYDITTQVQRNYFESISLKRTWEVQPNGSVFRYSRIKDTLYFGFKKENGFFMATPEKALLDAVYLISLGRYAIDMSALDATRINEDEIRRMGRKFPVKTQRLLVKHGYLKATRNL